MLNEAPKKKKKQVDYSDPTGWQYFWRTQRECLRRAVSPFLMYMFMNMISLAGQAIDAMAAKIVIGIVCVAGGMFFNAHLLYNTGKLHYGAYVAGVLHRRNAAFGVKSGGDHRVEREYRVWKGFLIGFYIGIPVLIMGILLGSLQRPETIVSWAYVSYALMMFAGWAILPLTWFGTGANNTFLAVSGYWSLLFLLIPILVSGIAYIVGAMKDKRDRDEAAARDKAVENAGRAMAEGKGRKK